MSFSAIDALSAADPLQPSLVSTHLNNPNQHHHQQQQDNGVWLIVIVFGYIFGLFLIFVIIWFIWYGTSIKRTNAYNRQLRNGTLNSGQTASTHHFYDYSSQSTLNRPLAAAVNANAALAATHQMPSMGTSVVNTSPNCSYSPVAIASAGNNAGVVSAGAGGRKNQAFCNRDEAIVIAAGMYHHHHHGGGGNPNGHHYHHATAGHYNPHHHHMANGSSSNNQLVNNQDDLTSSHSTSFIHSYQHRI